MFSGQHFAGVPTPFIFLEMLTRQQDMNAPSNRVAMPIPAIKRPLAAFFAKLPGNFHVTPPKKRARPLNNHSKKELRL